MEVQIPSPDTLKITTAVLGGQAVNPFHTCCGRHSGTEPGRDAPGNDCLSVLVPHGAALRIQCYSSRITEAQTELL